jgi:hypothetical protein
VHLPEDTQSITWTTNLEKLVQKCPHLKILSVSQWMEEECQKFLNVSHFILEAIWARIEM